MFGFSDLNDFLTNVPSQFAIMFSVLLGSVRMAAMMVTFPLFSLGNLRGRVMAGSAAAFSLPISIMIYPDITLRSTQDYVHVMGLIIKEAMLGMILGTLLALPLLAIQTVGDLVDQNRGASQANQTDPVNANEVSLLGQSFMLIALLIFVSHGGLLTILKAVYASYEFWPVVEFKPPVGWDIATQFGRLLADVMRMGFILGTPFLLAFFALDIALGLIGKFAQKFNLQDILPYLKNILTVLLLPFYLLFLDQYLQPEWGKLIETGRNFLKPR